MNCESIDHDNNYDSEVNCESIDHDNVTMNCESIDHDNVTILQVTVRL